MNHPLFGIILTIFLYRFAMKLQLKLKSPLLNPLLVSSILIIILLLCTGIPYENFKLGGDYIGMLIGPATVSLAIPLYENLHILKNHARLIILSILSGTLAHAIVIAILAIILNLDQAMIATIIPKSVTTAIAVDISSSLNGISTLTICIVVITGIFGASLAPILNKIFKFTSPLAQGIALGVSAHAVGTSKAVEMGKLQGTLSSLSLIVTGIITVITSPLIFMIINAIN